MTTRTAVVLAALTLYGSAWADDARELISQDETGRITMTAVRIDEPLELDGQLDDEVYTKFVPASGFIQQEPLEGQPATERTEVWLFFDQQSLYVAARCWDSQPDRIVANEMRRDSHNIDRNANFAVILDTFHDRRNGFLFHTNPLGALYDAQVTDESNSNSDWNTVWKVKTGRFDQGWTVEMEIPFKSLRYRPGGKQTWGVNFQREVQWKNETSHLAPIAAAFRWDGLLKLSQAATLEGIEPPSRALNLELKPYVTSGLSTDLTVDEPYENDLDADVGFDVKYGLTRSLTTDFTYNTDFAQVENDEEQVNLTRFSLFFPEKRDFFLEGQGIFNFGGRETGFWGGSSDTPIMFFSRRIGLEDGVAVPINAGGRITGRAGAYSIGALAMQTDSVGSEVPTTNFGVVRVKRDVFRRSNIGFIGTYRSESVETDGSNQLFGIDGNFSFYQNVNINTYWARSATGSIDENDTSYRGSFEYGGDRYGVEAERLVVQENFNPEVGFLRRDDFQKSSAQLRFSPRVPSIEAIRRISLEGRIDYFTDNEGTLETREVEIEFGPELESGDDIELTYQNSYEYLEEDFEISDGIVIPTGSYSFQSLEASYRLGPQHRMSGGLSVSYGSFYSGNRIEIGYRRGRIEVTPQLSLEPGFSVNWVDLEEGEFVAQVYRVRANYTFTPRAFVAALVQYNSESTSFSSNIRFRWEYQPGSDIYVVYTDWRDTERGGFGLENRSLVLKFTRLFRF